MNDAGAHLATDGARGDRPELWDFWRALVERGDLDARTLHRARCACKALAAIVDERASTHVSFTFGRATSFLDAAPSTRLRERVFRVDFGHCMGNVRLSSLPQRLKTLRLGCSAGHHVPLCDVPRSVTSLRLGHDFEQDVRTGDLPDGLLHLTTNDLFDRVLAPGSLPASLTHLRLGLRFNRALDASNLPRTLVELHVGALFREPLRARDLPRSLRTLSLASVFSAPFEVGDLPDEMTTLELSARAPHGPVRFPASLTRLSCSWTRAGDWPLLANLPRSLTSLGLTGVFDGHVDAGALPRSLRDLTLGDDFKHALDVSALPPAMLSLTFGASYDRRVDGALLPSPLLRVNPSSLLIHPTISNAPSKGRDLVARGDRRVRHGQLK